MSEDQRIGQLLMVGLQDDQLSSSEAAAIRAHHIGSVTFIQTTMVGVAAVRVVTDAVQALVTSDNTARVRFFVSANQEGGVIQALRGPGFSSIPSAVVQGQMDTGELTASWSRWGRELLAAGVNLNLAPVLDVVPPGTDAENQPIGVLQREYGHDPTTVADRGLAMIRGMERAGVSTTAKHFPGLGRVQGNTDFTAGVTDTSTTSDDPFLFPFRQAIDAGVPFVMVALATYTRIDPNRLAVFSPVVMDDLLRHRLGFRGVIVSDDLGAARAVESISPGQRAIDFILAGGDMLISKTVTAATEMSDGLRSRAESDPGFRARIDDSVLRVLSAKQAAGLLPCGR